MDLEKVAEAIWRSDPFRMGDPDAWTGEGDQQPYLEMAAAAVDALQLPDRVFVDNLGQRWEWCGGGNSTWAWRRTADAVEFNEEVRSYERFEVVSESGGEGVMRHGGQKVVRLGHAIESRLVSPWVVQQEEEQ